MSYDLRIWEQPADRPPPATLEDAGRAMLALEGKRPGVNSKFIALGRRMSERFPTAGRNATRDDAVWASDPVGEAEALDEAVWVIAISPDNRVPVTFFVVETATALGLTVLDEQLGMAFSPGGKVLPDERRPLWEGLRRELTQPAEPAATKADVRKAMATFLRESVQKVGFRHDPSNKQVDVAFTRATPAGIQTVDLTLDGALPRLKCSIYCRQRNEQVEAIHGAALGPDAAKPHTFVFNAGAFIGEFNSGIPFASLQEIKEIFRRVDTQALPALERSTSLEGLNALVNDAEAYPLEYRYEHPLDPRSLAGYFHSRSLRPLIVAWLAQDPRFPRLIEEYRQIAMRESWVKSADLEKLLAHLDQRARPAVDEGTPASDV